MTTTRDGGLSTISLAALTLNVSSGREQVWLNHVLNPVAEVPVAELGMTLLCCLPLQMILRTAYRQDYEQD